MKENSLRFSNQRTSVLITFVILLSAVTDTVVMSQDYIKAEGPLVITEEDSAKGYIIRGAVKKWLGPIPPEDLPPLRIPEAIDDQYVSKLYVNEIGDTVFWCAAYARTVTKQSCFDIVRRFADEIPSFYGMLELWEVRSAIAAFNDEKLTEALFNVHTDTSEEFRLVYLSAIQNIESEEPATADLMKSDYSNLGTS